MANDSHPRHESRRENLTVVCGTHVHVKFIINFISKLYENKCIEQVNKYTDLLFIINNSESEKHFVEQCTDKSDALSCVSLFDLLQQDTGAEIWYDNQSDYESSCFKYVQDSMTSSYDFMLFLQATTEFCDPRAFDLVFDNEDELYLEPHGYCCLIKMSMDTIEKIRFPSCGGKWGSIKFENYLKQYCDRRGVRYAFIDYEPILRTEEIHSHGYIQEAFGRMNCIRECEMFIKYRGSWSRESTDRVIEEGKWN
jgi:hypothetical protein